MHWEIPLGGNSRKDSSILSRDIHREHDMTDAEQQILTDAIRAVEQSVKARNPDPDNLSFDLTEIEDFLQDVRVSDTGDSLEFWYLQASRNFKTISLCPTLNTAKGDTVYKLNEDVDIPERVCPNVRMDLKSLPDFYLHTFYARRLPE